MPLRDVELLPGHFILRLTGPDGELREVPLHRVREVYRDGRLIWWLQAGGVPITPAYFKRFMIMPEPLVVRFLKQMILAEEMETALVGHARAAKDDILLLADELRFYARVVGVPTPTGDQLYPFLAGEPRLVPRGQADLKMDWSKIVAGAAALTTVGIGVAAILALLRQRSKAG